MNLTVMGCPLTTEYPTPIPPEDNIRNKQMNYLTQLEYLNPYPLKKEYRIEASNIATAAARAIKKWKSENKNVRLKTLRIAITRINSVKEV